MMRIISLLPAATEILYELEAGDQLVGRSYDCDFPLEVNQAPIVVLSTLKENLPSRFVDQFVSKALKSGKSLYKVNNQLFASLKPDLVITQQLCEVCAITPTDIQAAIRDCKPQPDILSLHPHSLTEIMDNMTKIGEAIGKGMEARKSVKSLRSRLERVKNKTKNLENKPQVYCMEWLDPPYSGGHWVPEQVEIAGGRDELANKGVDSAKIMWQKIADYDPGIIILMPCGFLIERTKRELNVLINRSEWLKLKAVRENRVYLVNGPAYFNCAGPRIVDGIELLATIFHPELFPDLDSKFSTKDVQMIV